MIDTPMHAPNAYDAQMSIKKYIQSFRLRFMPNITLPRQE